MKKLIFSIILIFVTLFSFSQDQEWERDYDFEEVLLNDWDVELEVWTIEHDNGLMTVNFEDFVSLNWDDVYYQLSFTLIAFEEIMLEHELDFDEVDVDMFIFSWFEFYDRFDRYNENTNDRWDIHMDHRWLIRYYDARWNAQYDMIEMLARPIYDEWRSQQREQNFFNRKR